MDVPSTAHLLQRCMQHSLIEAILEALMEVAYWPQLFLDPTFLNTFRIFRQLLAIELAGEQRFKCSLRREHSALDRQMDTLEPLRIEHAGRVAADHPAVAGERGH